MSVTAATLRELHRIHKQLSDLRDRLARGPKQIVLGETAVAKLEEELAAARENVKKTKLSAHEKELQLKTNESRIEDLRRKLNACSSNREYQALLEQIAADEMANSVLSDEIVEMLDKIEQFGAAVAASDANLTKGRDELAKTRARVEEQKQSLEGDVARLTNELSQAEQQLPGDFRPEYERLVRSKGEQALAEVDENSCGGCYQTITPQMLSDLHLSKPVFCKSCGALLYFPEGRGK